MSLRLVTRNIGARGPASAAIFSRSIMTTDQCTDAKKTPSAGSKVPHDQWMASLASESEQAVKADRSDSKLSTKEMQEKTQQVANELRNSTSSLTDGLWRSIGGGK